MFWSVSAGKATRSYPGPVGREQRAHGGATLDAAAEAD